MKKKTLFLLLLSLPSVSSLAFADSFYAGVQAGADFFLVKKHAVAEVRNFTVRPPRFDSVFAESRNSGTGGVGGGFLGYAWQFQDGSLGVEGFAYGDGSRSSQFIRAGDNNSRFGLSTTEKLQGSYGLSLKPGYLVNEKARLYGKVGWAQGRFSVQGFENEVAGGGSLGGGAASHNKWLAGWQLGGGTEVFMNPYFALTFEYHHIQYKRIKFASGGNLLINNVGFSQNIATEHHPQGNNVLLGVTYYFTGQDFGGYVVRDDGGYDT